MKINKLILLLPLFATINSIAQNINQTQVNSPGSIQIIINNGTIKYNLDSTLKSLEKYRGQKINLTGKNEIEQVKQLRSELLPFLQDARVYYEKIQDSLVNLNQQSTEAFRRIEALNKDLDEVIAELYTNKKSLEKLTTLAVTFNSQQTEQIRLLASMNRKWDQDSIYRNFSRDRKLERYKKLRNAQSVKLQELAISAEAPFLHMKNGNQSIKFQTQYGFGLHYNFARRHGPDRTFNPNYTISLLHGSMDNSSEQIRYITVSLKAGVDITLGSEDIYRKARESNFFPIGVELSTIVYNQYTNNYSGLENYALNSRNSNTELSRINLVQPMLYAGYKLKRISMRKLTNWGFSIIGRYPLTNYFRQSYIDQRKNTPYANLKSKFYNVSISILHQLL